MLVNDINGPNGKGVAAKRLGLSHFVDNKCEVLESVVADKAGNSGVFIQRFQGTLFHFATGGSGKWKPGRPPAMSSELQQYYCAVSGWKEVLSKFGKDKDGAEWTSEEKFQGSKEAQNWLQDADLGDSAVHQSERSRIGRLFILLSSCKNFWGPSIT